MVDLSASTVAGHDYPPTLDQARLAHQTRAGVVEFGVAIKNRKLNFTVHDIVGNFSRFDEAEQRRFLAIDEDSKLEIRLSDDVEWEFDFSPKGGDGDTSPIRMKDETAVSYCRVTKLDASNKRILLEAKRSESAEWTPHAFNIYVLIAQRLGDPLPIRIDPIVDNPPK